MKITCEHCGVVIDIEHDKKCPNCKAPYSDNKEYKKIREYVDREKKANVESRELGNEIVKNVLGHFKSVSIISKIIFAFCFIVFILIFVFGISMMLRR